MKSWALYGIRKKLTEEFKKTDQDTKKMNKIFSKSMHIYPIDTGNSGDLNFEMAALSAPQYNIHRFGIFFTDSPRHADLLIILGKVTKAMEKPLFETLNQIPQPFGIMIIEDKNDFGTSAKNLNLPNIVAYFDKKIDAPDILSALLNIMEEK